MRPPLLLVHGWGYDASFWNPLAACLPGRQLFRADMGYLGAEPCWPVVPAGAILVAHSAGLAILLERRPAEAAGLVAINGFTRFVSGADFAAVPERVVLRMQRELSVDPGAVLDRFRARCGDAGATGVLNAHRLGAGLAMLRRSDSGAELRRLGVPVLALAATDDPIVTPAHARNCFEPDALRWSTSGGHLLPLTRPDWCAAMIDALPC